MRCSCALSLLLLFTLPTLADDGLRFPDIEPVELETCGKITFKHIEEPSGLARSRLWPEVMWTHNDSGDKARLFAITKSGELISPESAKSYKGIHILDAVHIDWEDIATDTDGNLFIGAFGNNSNARRDLAIYVVREPNPRHIEETRTLAKISFAYPDQMSFPARTRSFDAEALFYANRNLYILTKHRDDRQTNLYRLESFQDAEPHRLHVLTRLAGFDIRGRVTGADATADGTRLAVLTYNAIWLFEPRDGSDSYFEGKISWLPLDAQQYEGVTFYDDSLILSNEKNALYQVPLGELRILRP